MRKEIKMEEVNSSQIARVGYDRNTSTLYVEFKNHSIYRYLNVPADKYKDMMSNASVGTYLRNVIQPSYKFEKV